MEAALVKANPPLHNTHRTDAAQNQTQQSEERERPHIPGLLSLTGFSVPTRVTQRCVANTSRTAQREHRSSFVRRRTITFPKQSAVFPSCVFVRWLTTTVFQIS